MRHERQISQQKEISTILSNALKVLTKKLRSIVAIIVCCIFTIILNTHTGKTVLSTCDDFLANIYSKIDIPIQWINANILNFIDYMHAAYSYKEILIENTKLKKQIATLALLEQQNQELIKIANYVNGLDVQYITTRAVSASKDALSTKLMINVGDQNGIMEGQAVLNEDGLIGRVVKVNKHSARILLLNNEASKIPVYLIESRIRCIAVGMSYNDYLKLLYLPSDTTPIEGETVVTSGEGSVLPFGVKVGTIVKNTQPLIRPSARLNTISTIAVVKANKSTLD